MAGQGDAERGWGVRSATAHGQGRPPGMTRSSREAEAEASRMEGGAGGVEGSKQGLVYSLQGAPAAQGPPGPCARAPEKRQ